MYISILYFKTGSFCYEYNEKSFPFERTGVELQKQQDQYLRRNHPEEHGQRVNGRIIVFRYGVRFSHYRDLVAYL